MNNDMKFESSETKITGDENSSFIIEAIRLWASNMELNKIQLAKFQYLVTMIKTLLTVIIVELGILIGLLIILEMHV